MWHNRSAIGNNYRPAAQSFSILVGHENCMFQHTLGDGLQARSSFDIQAILCLNKNNPANLGMPMEWPKHDLIEYDPKRHEIRLRIDWKNFQNCWLLLMFQGKLSSYSTCGCNPLLALRCCTIVVISFAAILP